MVIHCKVKICRVSAKMGDEQPEIPKIQITGLIESDYDQLYDGMYLIMTLYDIENLKLKK